MTFSEINKATYWKLQKSCNQVTKKSILETVWMLANFSPPPPHKVWICYYGDRQQCYGKKQQCYDDKQ